MVGHTLGAWNSSYADYFWKDVQTDNYVSKSNSNHTSYTKIAAGKETVPNDPTAGRVVLDFAAPHQYFLC